MDITSQTGFVEAARARFKPLISKRLSGPDGARAGGLACVAAGRAADHNISVHIDPNQDAKADQQRQHRGPAI
jgi:hypothetical protein